MFLMLYTLTNKDFEYRYSDIYKGYFISLNLDTKALFEKMPRAKVNVNIETIYDKINVVGIDYNGFEGFEIDTLTIMGEESAFYILDKSLYDTRLQTLKYSQGITIDYSADAFNNEFLEVVVWNGIPM